MIRHVNKKKEVTTHALLNNWSQGTFLREGIIRKLEASGARTKKRKTMNGGQTHLSTTADGLEVASNSKSFNKQWIKLPKSYTTSDFPTEAKEVETKEKRRKWKYLDNKSKKTCQDDNIKIGILSKLFKDNRTNGSNSKSRRKALCIPHSLGLVHCWFIGRKNWTTKFTLQHNQMEFSLHQSNGRAFSCCRNSS